MTCIYTGALISFTEYGTISRGDLHQVGEAFVFYGSPPYFPDPKDQDEKPTHIMRLGQSGFHRKTEPYQVWVSLFARRVE